MSNLKRKVSQAEVSNRIVIGADERQRTTTKAPVSDKDRTERADAIHTATQLRLIVTGKLPPTPTVNRVQAIFTVSENERKSLQHQQRKHPPTELWNIISDNPSVLEILCGWTPNKSVAIKNHEINLRVKKLKLRCRTAEDIKKLKDKTLEEERRATGAMQDLLGGSGDTTLDIEFLLVRSMKMGEESKAAAREWRGVTGDGSLFWIWDLG